MKEPLHCLTLSQYNTEIHGNVCHIFSLLENLINIINILRVTETGKSSEKLMVCLLLLFLILTPKFFWNCHILITLKLLCVFINFFSDTLGCSYSVRSDQCLFPTLKLRPRNDFLQHQKYTFCYLLSGETNLWCSDRGDLELWLKSFINSFLLRQLRESSTRNVRLWFD